MGSNINGFQNEIDLLTYLKDKSYYELNENMKKFIKFIYPSVLDTDILHANTGKSGQKPDLELEINGIKKFVSVKIGSGNSVHQENIDLFMDFLTQLNISQDAKMELLKFHWADGTTDGTGKIRISSDEYKNRHIKEIQLINDELNKRDVLDKIITRILFQGKSDEYDLVDFIYYGGVLNGHWASRKEIIDYVTNNTYVSTCIHFGPLNYQIWNRCLNFNPDTETRRNVMQSKWTSLLNDLIRIEKGRDVSE